ncbi:MAG: hypothetical protein WBA10_09665 [Elainellaceae cyanobacterium]
MQGSQMQNDYRKRDADASAQALSCWLRCIYAVLIISALSIYQQGVVSRPEKIVHNHWEAIMSEDFKEITRQYDMNAVLVWNDYGGESVYLGTQIGDYWQFFFSQNAIETYAVSNIERDRRTIKANIIATACSSKGKARKIYISHKVDVNSRGKIIKEVWTANRRK